MPLFQFELRALEAIAPWGGATPSLSWFGLTDGWYWLAAGGDEILRTAEPAPGEPPYCGYQVVRLWEDILEMLPDVLAPRPAPADVAREPGLPLLDTFYLRHAPDVWMWRTGDRVHLVWRAAPDGAALWVPVSGEASMPVARFIDEVVDFDRRLMHAMKARVSQLVLRGGLPGVAIDLAQLRAEHADRTTWLQSALALAAPHR